MSKIYSHKDLEVYKLAMEIFEFSKSFPKEEIYSLTDQIRRSSRSAAVNLPEAWRKRKYPKHFVSNITDSEGEASETQFWLEFSKDCGYISEEIRQRLDKEYDKLLGMLVNMRTNPGQWTL